MLALLYDRVNDVAKHQWYRAHGLQVDAKLVHDLALPYPLRGNLYHVVLKDVKPCRLRVKHYDVTTVIGSQESLEISVVVICRAT